MSFISLFKIIKVAACEAESERRREACIFFWIPASITEAAAVTLDGTKMFFGNGTATSSNKPANLLNDEPKNPPD